MAPDCRMRGTLWRARAAFIEVLDRTTLADCLTPGLSELPGMPAIAP
jgi:Rrf2 family transcriptional regulator, nitric oxide-sensitive transcriptional repressor